MRLITKNWDGPILDVPDMDRAVEDCVERSEKKPEDYDPRMVESFVLAVFSRDFSNGRGLFVI